MNILTLHRLSVTAGLLVCFALTSIAALAQDGERVLAEVNGRQIKQRDVDALVLAQVMPLEDQLYAIRQVALDNLIITSILEGEAKSQKISLELLRRKLSAGRVEIAQSDIEKAYTENLSAFASLSPDEARERLRLDLETQTRMRFFSDAVARLRGKAQVRLFLEEPRLPELAITSTAAVRGAPGSAVTIVEFGDFQCSYCRESQAVIKQIVDKFKSEVKLVFKHLPLDIHSHAEASARAAFCAGEQARRLVPRSSPQRLGRPVGPHHRRRPAREDAGAAVLHQRRKAAKAPRSPEDRRAHGRDHGGAG